MEQSVRIKSSSSGEIYTVTFKIDNLISINCNCQAGLVKTLCKHRLSLLDGDTTSIVDEKDILILNEVLSKIDKAKVENLFAEFDKVEAEIKKLDALKKRLKKEIGLNFSNGF